MSKISILFLVIVFLTSLLPLSGEVYAAVSFSATELLGRPTDTSVTVNVVPSANGYVYFEYGTATSDYTAQTSTATLASGTPTNVVIQGLDANTKYYYRMESSSDGTNWTPGTEHTFWTQRDPGSTFTYTIIADSHMNGGGGTESLYVQTLNNVANDHPDFHLDLGDTFWMDGVTSSTTANQHYLNQRQWMSVVSHSAAIFIATGNHENEEGWNFDDPNSKALLSINARKLYYPSPIPGGSFYTGNTDTLAAINGDHYREDYYSWTWGDALYVVIDPFQYTMTNPYGTAGGEEGDEIVSGDSWNWTLGEQQYLWFKNVLETSDAKYKFVFAHHIVGGMPSYLYVRGGAEGVPYYEWGGNNWSGTWQFDTKRPGWEAPIHQLMVANHVSAFFHGHDHEYAYEVRDGIVYQLVPQPGNTGYGFGLYDESDPYTEKVLPSPGHLRVTVSPTQATVDYVGTSGGGVNYSYTIPPNAGNEAPEVSDIPDQTIAEGETFATIDLDDYVYDPDNTDAEMTWTYSGNTELTVSIVSRVATIGIPYTEWNGAETITFRATDPGALWDEDSATFTVFALTSVISGIIADVKGAAIPGATVKLYLDGVLQSTTTSGPDGQYELVATEEDEYTVVASAAGFKNETQAISITSLGDGYTLDFIGNSGLIPQAPDLSYVLACANHWLYPPVNHPELTLSMSKVLAVANAWLYH